MRSFALPLWCWTLAIRPSGNQATCGAQSEEPLRIDHTQGTLCDSLALVQCRSPPQQSLVAENASDAEEVNGSVSWQTASPAVRDDSFAVANASHFSTTAKHRDLDPSSKFGHRWVALISVARTLQESLEHQGRSTSHPLLWIAVSAVILLLFFACAPVLAWSSWANRQEPGAEKLSPKTKLFRAAPTRQSLMSAGKSMLSGRSSVTGVGDVGHLAIGASASAAVSEAERLSQQAPLLLGSAEEREQLLTTSPIAPTLTAWLLLTLSDEDDKGQKDSFLSSSRQAHWSQESGTPLTISASSHMFKFDTEARSDSATPAWLFRVALSDIASVGASGGCMEVCPVGDAAPLAVTVRMAPGGGSPVALEVSSLKSVHSPLMAIRPLECAKAVAGRSFDISDGDGKHNGELRFTPRGATLFSVTDRPLLEFATEASCLELVVRSSDGKLAARFARGAKGTKHAEYVELLVEPHVDVVAVVGCLLGMVIFSNFS